MIKTKPLSFRAKDTIKIYIVGGILIALLLGTTHGISIPYTIAAIGLFISPIVLEIISSFAEHKIAKGNVDLDSWYYCVVDSKLRERDVYFKKIR